jgi:membrane protease YdiL (CAAX protease family)
VSSVPPSRPGAPTPPERPELPDGIAPPAAPSAEHQPAGPQIEFRPPVKRSFAARDDVPPWPPWSAAVAFVGAFAVALVGGIVLAIIGTGFGVSLDDPTPAVNISATVVQDLAFVGVPILLSWLMFRRVVPAWFGVNRTPLWPAVGMTLLMMLSYYVLSAVYAGLLDLSEPDQLPDSLGVEQSTAALIAVCILVTVIAPIAEEVLFRGFMFGALRNWRGPIVSAVITGIVFGAIHAGGTEVEFLVPLALLGVFLALLRWRTGSLLPCMVVHAFNNSIAFGVNAADWGAWQVILLILGSNAVILLVTWPFLGPRANRPAQAAS